MASKISPSAKAIIEFDPPQGIPIEQMSLPIDVLEKHKDYVVIQYKGERDYKKKKRTLKEHLKDK